MERSKRSLFQLIVSAFEKEHQDARKPDVNRQYNLQLDSKLTISAKRRHTSTEPTDEIRLSAKYSIATIFKLLAQMKQPGRSIYKDFDQNTFMDFLDMLLDRDNFYFYKEVEGRPLVAPKWSSCLSYELEVRKEAIELCKERYMGIKEALWGVENTEHRMKHRLQPVAIPNAPEAVHKQDITDLKHRVAAKDCRRARSRSPRKQQQSRATTLPAPASSSSPAPGQGKN